MASSLLNLIGELRSWKTEAVPEMEMERGREREGGVPPGVWQGHGYSQINTPTARSSHFPTTSITACMPAK